MPATYLQTILKQLGYFTVVFLINIASVETSFDIHRCFFGDTVTERIKSNEYSLGYRDGLKVAVKNAVP